MPSRLRSARCRRSASLRPSDERGFNLYAPDHGFAVAFSKLGEEFRSAHLLVRPWFETVSSTPHDGISTSKYATAGKILDEMQRAKESCILNYR
jgi:hypothetical protein